MEREALLRLAPLLTATAGYCFGVLQTRSDASVLPYVDIKLEDKGIRAGADAGNPVRRCTMLLALPRLFDAMYRRSQMVKLKTFEAGNTNGAGVWECAPGGFPVVNRPSTETVLILKGKGRITNADGSKVELTPGMWHTLPTGWTGRWDIDEPLRKLYVITP